MKTHLLLATLVAAHLAPLASAQLPKLQGRCEGLGSYAMFNPSDESETKALHKVQVSFLRLSSAPEKLIASYEIAIASGPVVRWSQTQPDPSGIQFEIADECNLIVRESKAKPVTNSLFNKCERTAVVTYWFPGGETFVGNLTCEKLEF
jgi:hypothetical protein